MNTLDDAHADEVAALGAGVNQGVDLAMRSFVSPLELIRRIPLLCHLSTSQATELSAQFGKRRYEKGEFLARQGEPSIWVNFVLAGRARVVSDGPRGRVVFHGRLRTGDLVEETTLIEGQPNSASVIAEVHTDVLTLARSSFLHCVHANGDLARAVLMRLAQRMRAQERRITSLALLNVRDRVMSALIELATVHDGGVMQIPDHVSRQDMARMVGASREAVSRVLTDLESIRWIDIDAKRRITLQPQLIEQAWPMPVEAGADFRPKV